jgi:hypothetical protein
MQLRKKLIKLSGGTLFGLPSHEGVLSVYLQEVKNLNLNFNGMAK